MNRRSHLSAPYTDLLDRRNDQRYGTEDLGARGDLLRSRNAQGVGLERIEPQKEVFEELGAERALPLFPFPIEGFPF